VSKTFKALQRAAQEQALRQRRELGDGPPLPAPPKPAPPSASRARVIALSGMVVDPDGHSPPRPRALSATEDKGVLRSEIDPTLREILEQSLRPGCPTLEILSDGWVRGRLDPGALLRLLRRHNLLHCLQRDEESTFWFWASAREAAELAEATGYRLDPVERPQGLRD
jgi:hypothetical protein